MTIKKRMLHRHSKTAIIAILCVVVFGMMALRRLAPQSQLRSGESISQTCAMDDQTELLKCWESEIGEVIASQGVITALNAVAYLNERDDRFVKHCHDFMHTVGYRAYREYTRRGHVEVNDKTSYCSFGFYHGFMEMLVGKHNDPKGARDFCLDIGKQLDEVVPDAKYACFHGIGHGWSEVHDQRFIGDERGISSTSLQLCEDVSDPQDPEQLYRCATGVFDSVALAYYNNDNGMIMNTEDPLWLCREQTSDVFKRACYSDMMPAIVWMADYDLETAAAIVATHAERDYQPHAMFTVIDDSMRFVLNAGGDPYEMVSVCRKLEYDDVTAACIDGISAGVLQWGRQSERFGDTLQFCADADLTDEERSRCYFGVASYAQQVYADVKRLEICSQIPDTYKQVCERFE